MKWYITYFSNLRYLDDTYLPINTTIWPPKFYKIKGHTDIMGQYHQKTYKEGNLWLGTTANEIIFPNLTAGEDTCPCNKKDPFVCGFIKAYMGKLRSVDFKAFERRYTFFAATVSSKIDKLVLIVYEKPDNPCSERGSLIQWFKENGIELEEFIKPAVSKTTTTMVASLFTK